MFNNSQIISVLELLNLSYYVQDNLIYIIDPENEDATYIERSGKDGYKFTIGDLTCFFDNQTITIKKDNRQMIIYGKNISYQRKKDNSPFNTTSFRILNNGITFYRNEDDVASAVTFNYDIDYSYYSMKKSSSIHDETGTSKEDIEFYTEEEPIAKHIIRKYDSDGKMVTGSIYEDTLVLPISACISDEIITNPIIPEVISELEDMVPGITDYYGKTNPNIRDINTRIKNQYK